MRVVVIGGGLAGLTCALELRERGHDVQVLEREARPGGKVRTERLGDWQLELGPSSLTANAPATEALLQRIGLAGEVVPSAEAAKHRFVVRNRKLREVPDSPPKLVTSRAISLADRWHILREPNAAPPPVDIDETVAEFASRRFGPELARRLVEPMVTGVFAGDYAQLSVKSAFPRVAAMEREHGSLVKALIALERARRSAGGPRPSSGLTTLRGGMERLPAALAACLGPALRPGTEVESLQRETDGLTVRTTAGPVAAERVVLALPADDAARVCRSLDPTLADAYAAIPIAGVASVSLGFAAGEVTQSLAGFGFLVPRIEGLRLLGALWMTSSFPDHKQAPHGHVLIRCLIGGALDPGALELSDEGLIACAREGLAGAMRLSAEPCFTHVARWPSAIAQYVIGHADRVGVIEARGVQFGVYPSGAALRGIGVHDVIREAQATAARLHATP
jgi:oxygen-dependent protoporphyrinogen oxidase